MTVGKGNLIGFENLRDEKFIPDFFGGIGLEIFRVVPVTGGEFH
jgi:hypothetical protein